MTFQRCAIAFFSLLAPAMQPGLSAAEWKPNIVIILADDKC